MDPLFTHGAYAIKHRQHIEINSRKTGIVTFHQLKRKYFMEWEKLRGDGMTAIKRAMNNYQSCLQTNTKISKLFKKGFYFLKCRFSFLIIL